ncbi:MAG: Smr/MutS family protein [Saprospiraceae bacterium]
MVDPGELWIGDWLMIKSNGLKGRFNGVDEKGNIMIMTKDQNKVFVLASNIEKIQDEPDVLVEIRNASINEKVQKLELADDFGDTLDLHYEKLIPLFPHLSGSKLEFQMDICTRFIKAAIHSRLPNIQIIHGRGQGILKNEVERLLKQYNEITIISSNPNLASVDAWMNYH